MNVLDYTEVEIDLPNIVYRRKNTEAERPTSIDRGVKPFVMELAKKHPQWKFVSYRHYRNVDYVAATAFRVYENRELLGEIGCDTHGSKNVFTYTNQRIQSKRQRGKEAKTKDLKKAVRAVGLSFGAKTIDELLGEASNVAHTVIKGNANDAASMFSSTFKHISEALRTHIMEHYDEFAPLAVKGGATQAVVDTLMTNYERKVQTAAMQDVLERGNGFLVVIRGDDYAVMSRQGKTDVATRIYDTDGLPPHIKKCIGLLKLTEPHVLVPGIGVKTGNNSFFVTAEVKDE